MQFSEKIRRKGFRSDEDYARAVAKAGNDYFKDRVAVFLFLLSLAYFFLPFPDGPWGVVCLLATATVIIYLVNSRRKKKFPPPKLPT